MTNEIYIYEKPSLIKAMLDIKRGLHKITNYFIRLEDVGLKENPDLLFKILLHSDGLCKINYQHEEYVYTYMQEILDDNYYLSQLDSNAKNANGSNSYTDSNYNPDIYDWNDWKCYLVKDQERKAKVQEMKAKIYAPLKNLTYYISPIGDYTRFINMLGHRITILEKVEDFTITKVPSCIHPEDLNLSTYKFIYVLKPKQKEAINMLANILEKLSGDISYYIFIFKCGKTWFTLSRHREISLGYFTGSILNINGVHYDFEKIKEVLENVHINKSN